MFFITRICHNTANWQHPTASAEAETNSFYSRYGYGHEEWLFRTEWNLGGWQYGFLQGVNDEGRRATLLSDGIKVADVTLFDIPARGKRRYVARIRQLELLDDAQSEAALLEYKNRGWYDTMLKEIESVDGNTSVFGAHIWAPLVLNVRFRTEDIEWYPPDTFAQSGDPTLQYRRYTFIQVKTDDQFPTTVNRRRTRVGQKTPPFQDTHFRGGGVAREVSPEHAAIQRELHKQLELEYPKAEIVFEQDFVDVSVRTGTETIFFEVKSDLNTRKVLRLALGQLLEYAYYWDSPSDENIRLVAVGRTELNAEDARYLSYLSDKFKLPFGYRQVKLPSDT
jgi:hypothetical protein